MNLTSPVTRRHALKLFGVSPIALALPSLSGRSNLKTADDCFQLIADWNGATLSTEELQHIYVTIWPSLYKVGYNYLKTPIQRKLTQFWDVEKVTRLLRVVASGDYPDILYAALDHPLKLVYGGWTVGGPEWACYIGWIKYRLLEAGKVEAPRLAKAKERFWLPSVLANLPNP
jgi:ABC-type glycerol-3-phosphate transport system substrate-binding protein